MDHLSTLVGKPLLQGLGVLALGVLVALCVPLAAFHWVSRLRTLRAALASAESRSQEATHERDLERYRLDAVFEHVADLIAEVAPDGTVLFMNGRLAATLGVDAKASAGRSAFTWVARAHRAESEAVWREIVAQGGTKDPVVVPVETRNGRRFFLELTASDYAFPGDRRLLVICRDVTQRHRDDSRRVERERELEQRIDEKSAEVRAFLDRVREQERLAAMGTLASGLAHQLNNPIGAISTAAEFAILARNEPDGRETCDQALERIVEEARRAGRIVRSSLGFAKSSVTPKWSEDLGGLVRRTAEVVRPYVEERGGALSLSVTRESMPVEMRPIELEQMLVNLVRNAAESRREGAHVEVRTRIESDVAIVEVADDGGGIPAEARSQIFDPFFTTRRDEGGTGLGLSVVRDIVIDHAGRIQLDDAPGPGGTIARIELPLTLPPTAA